MAKQGGERATLGQQVRQLQEAVKKLTGQVEVTNHKIVQVAKDSNDQHEDTRARIKAIEEEIK